MQFHYLTIEASTSFFTVNGFQICNVAKLHYSFARNAIFYISSRFSTSCSLIILPHSFRSAPRIVTSGNLRSNFLNRRRVIEPRLWERIWMGRIGLFQNGYSQSSRFSVLLESALRTRLQSQEQCFLQRICTKQNLDFSLWADALRFLLSASFSYTFLSLFSLSSTPCFLSKSFKNLGSDRSQKFTNYGSNDQFQDNLLI